MVEAPGWAPHVGWGALRLRTSGGVQEKRRLFNEVLLEGTSVSKAAC